jgi:hypothetical protein
MSGQLSLLGKPTLTVERNDGTKLVLLLSITGLISGILTAGLNYPVGRLCVGHPQLRWFILGTPFGVCLAVSLATSGILRGFNGLWKAILLVVWSSVAYFVSVWAAAGLELAIPTRSELPPFDYPRSMFAGGFVGGLLMLGGVFVLVYSTWGWPTITNTQEPTRTAVFKVLLFSVLCGILGIVGRKLGPYLGIYLWSVFHDLCLTPPTETFQNALGESSRQYSLYVVWQTGTAAALGFILQSQRSDDRVRKSTVQNFFGV